MRIKKVECEQFAGLTSKDIEFDKGLNIVIGDNESGKSTLIDLIYQLLFKDVKIDGRSDSEFIDKYFPKKVSGPQGDVIDGMIVFETPAGTYKLRKEWEKGGGISRLTLPDGTSIKGNSEINEVLTGELNHRAGVYSEIVFASQKRKQIAIESIMRSLSKKTDTLSDMRTDLISTLTQAVLETGGVSIDKVEKAIKKNLDDLIGRWDWTADAPEGGPKRATFKNAWSGGAGLIVKAYYETDQIRSKQIDEENAERAVEAEKEAIQVLQMKKKRIEGERETFQKYRGILGQLSLLTSSVEDLSVKIKEQNEAFEKWPSIRNDIEKAKELKDKQRHAQVRELYLKAEPVQNEYIEKKGEFEKYQEIDASDLKKLRNLIVKNQKEEAKLVGINLVAKIKELHSTEAKITTVASGEILDLSKGEVLISEAVDITVPGILDMQLLPQGVDIESVKGNLENYQNEIKTLLAKYDVNTFDELQIISDTYEGLKKQVEKLRFNIDIILGNESWENIKALNDVVPADIETEAEIKGKIIDLCGSKSVDSFIGGLESTLRDYEKKYENIDSLKESIEYLKREKDTKQNRLNSMEDIPEEYKEVSDPDQYDEELHNKIKDYEGQIAGHSDNLSEAERNLGEKSAEEYSDELQEKEAEWIALKTEYEHWQNIYNVFCRLKDQTGSNPIADIENRFRDYLQIISDGKLRLNSIDEQMSVQLASGSYVLTYDILSDGTKDTIALAFRLAMLEHLYPEGDGLVVFDDPFTDMDTKRVEQSCKLIQKFAEKNQVIFVTCDSKYRNYLSGNTIVSTLIA